MMLLALEPQLTFFRPPFIVEDFVNNLKGLENKSFFVFVLHGTHPGNCPNWIRRKLKTKGAKDLGYFISFGVDFWMGYIKRGIMFSPPDSPTKTELSSAEDFWEKSCYKICRSKSQGGTL